MREHIPKVRPWPLSCGTGMMNPCTGFQSEVDMRSNVSSEHQLSCKKRKRKKKEQVSNWHFIIGCIQQHKRKNTWDWTQQSSWSFTVGACATFWTRNTGRHGKKKLQFPPKGGDCYTTFLTRCTNHWFFSIRCRNLHSNPTWKVQDHFKLHNKSVSNVRVKEVVQHTHTRINKLPK